MKMQTKLKTRQNNEYKETELGLLPKEWTVVRLGDVAEKMKAGGTPRRGVKEYWKGKIPFVLIEDMTSCGLYLSKTKETITEEGLKNSSAWLVPINSLLLSMYATIGETAINTIPLATNQAILAILPKDNFDVVFGAYLLKFSAERLKMQNIQSTQKNVNKGVVENFKIPLPPLDEQKKITFILSTIQTAKEKTEQVIQATKEFKKSMMKHLFTYGPVSFEEAEKVKLKETEIGKIPEGWEVVRLGDVAKIKYGKANPKDKGNIPVIGSGGIFDYTSKPLVTQPTIIIGRKGTAGKTWLITEPCFPSDTTFYMDFKLEIVVKYLNEYLTYRPLSGEHAKTTLPSLQRHELENLPIPLPPLPTQQKIASILSAIDEKIQAEENKKKALDELFNSMLHNLMTAKIRVKDLSLEVKNV